MIKRRWLVGLLIALTAGGVTACGAGPAAETAKEVAAVPGADVNAGPDGQIALRNLQVVYGGPAGYPAGADAPLEIRIFNGGRNAVRLTGVSANDAAEAVTLVGSTPTGPASPSPAPRSSPAPATQGSSATPEPTTQPSATPEPTPSPRPTLAGPERTSFTIEIPPKSYVLLVRGQGSYLRLTGLRRPLIPGESVALRFTFEGIGPVDVTIPVGPPSTPMPRATA